MAESPPVSVLPIAAERPPKKRCDLCDGLYFHLISHLDRRGKPLDTGICAGCGLVAHWNIPSEERLNEFYAIRYRDEYHGEHTPSPRRVMRAWRNGQRIYRQLAPLIRPGDEVFEIGAGIGCTVKCFERHGHVASGIEPNGGFQEFSRDRLHAQVAGGYLFDLPPAPSHEVVLLVHVIEHFRSPREALEHVHRILKPSGRLYVECPNLGAPFTTRAKLFHFAHIHNFTPTTLRMMAKRCGFELEREFSKPRDPNLQMLFRHVTKGHLEIDPESCRQTLAALTRYSTLAYHLRWNYLAPRVAKLGSYLTERLVAKRYVERLLRECAADADRSNAKAA
jgi:SAM-dependent methyltransferase